MDTAHKSLLVRADFTLDRSRGGDRLTFKRWRRVLAAALPRLMGFADCRAALRLHHGDEEGRYSFWLRLPVERRPGRKRLARIREKLQGRLESVLLPVGGEVVKLGVRRFGPRHVLRLAPADGPLQLAPIEEVGRVGQAADSILFQSPGV